VGAGSQAEFRIVEADRGFKAYDVCIIDDEQPVQSAPAHAAN
jgi:hypothetical protein